MSCVDAVTRGLPAPRDRATPVRGPRAMPAGAWLAFALAAGAVMLAADAAALHAKAALAQVLLERAWTTSLDTGRPAKPWPWSDVAPVARLSVARLGVTRIVLGGDSGRSLAFAPGWSESSAPPASAGSSVISAHRDTHFAFLRELVHGDLIELQGLHATRRYRVEALHVVDSRRARIEVDPDHDRVLLVTCWPFDALDAGGPLRYLVEARAIDADSASAGRPHDRAAHRGAISRG